MPNDETRRTRLCSSFGLRVSLGFLVSSFRFWLTALPPSISFLASASLPSHGANSFFPGASGSFREHPASSKEHPPSFREHPPSFREHTASFRRQTPRLRIDVRGRRLQWGACPISRPRN